MISPELSVPQWLNIPQPIRVKIASIFGLSKSGGCEVNGNVVVSDGYSAADLKDLSLERLQSYLGSQETDFFVLLNKLIGQLSNVPTPEPEPTPKPEEKLVAAVKEVIAESIKANEKPTKVGSVGKKPRKKA